LVRPSERWSTSNKSRHKEGGVHCRICRAGCARHLPGAELTPHPERPCFGSAGLPASRGIFFGLLPSSPGRDAGTLPSYSRSQAPALTITHILDRLTPRKAADDWPVGAGPCACPGRISNPRRTFNRAFRTEILFECSRFFRRINPPVKPLSASRPQVPLQALVPACRETWAGTGTCPYSNRLAHCRPVHTVSSDIGYG
jgi:hypothetical protein